MINDIKEKSLGNDFTYREGKVYCKLWNKEIDVSIYDEYVQRAGFMR